LLFLQNFEEPTGATTEGKLSIVQSTADRVLAGPQQVSHLEKLPLMLSSRGAGSPLAGFVRFLQLLSQHPWKDRPLVVDPEAELTPAQHKDIDRRFDAAKAKGQLRGFTICTPTDLDGSAWGQGSMSTGMRQRLVKLAGRSLQVLQVCCMYQVSSCAFQLIQLKLAIVLGFTLWMYLSTVQLLLSTNK